MVKVYCKFLKHCVLWQWDWCASGGKSPSVGAEVVGAKVEVSRTQPPPAAAPQSLPRPCVCRGPREMLGIASCLRVKQLPPQTERRQDRKPQGRRWLHQVHNASPTRTESLSPWPPPMAGSPVQLGRMATGVTGP